MTVPSCRQKRTVAEPEAAYGPPGSTGEENISVVVAPIQPGFKLESLGTAEQAGRRFLETTVASINANREAKLLAAESRSAVLTSLVCGAQCLGCCVSHVVLVCYVASCCVADSVWAALCQPRMSLILFGVLCAATPVRGPQCIVETSLKLYNAHNGTFNMEHACKIEESVWMPCNADMTTLDSSTTTLSTQSSLRSSFDTMYPCMQPGVPQLSSANAQMSFMFEV